MILTAAICATTFAFGYAAGRRASRRETSQSVPLRRFATTYRINVDRALIDAPAPVHQIRGARVLALPAPAALEAEAA
jgi:aromatic ring hydroxylase